MSRKGGSIFGDLFGNLFDFDGDGDVSLEEEAIALDLLHGDTSTRSHGPYGTAAPGMGSDWRDTCEDGSAYGVYPEDYETEEEYEEALNEAKYAWRDTCEDGLQYGVDPEDYETEEEYEEALNLAKYGWRSTCEDGLLYDVNPEDYETEEEYREALNGAKYAWRDTCEDGLPYGVDPEDYETEEEYEDALEQAKQDTQTPEDQEPDEEQEPDDSDEDGDYGATPEGPSSPAAAADPAPGKSDPSCGGPKRRAYPNARKANAAALLHDLKSGYLIYGDEKLKALHIRRCEFILHNPDIVAAQYLTADGDYLFAQAVKEHFTLPFAVEDEDAEPEVPLAELLGDLANADALLALAVWEWCADTFYPYRHFAVFEDEIATSVLEQFSTLPDRFVDALIDHIVKDRKWAEVLLCGCESESYGYAELLAGLLKTGNSEIPKQMLAQYSAQEGVKPKEVGKLFEAIIGASGEDEDLAAMELVKTDLLPIIEKIPLLERKLPQYRKEIDKHIQYVETHADKYAWSRRYAWRAAWHDVPLFDLDPLDYETEAEYRKAAEKEKYRWRVWHERDEKTYGILTAEYETEAEYDEAVDRERQKRREVEEQQRAERRRQRAEEIRQRKVQKANPLADTDPTVYTFYGICFPNGPGVYYYRSHDSTLEIGDRVIVQTGATQRETEVEIVTVEKHRRATAPYPVDKTRFIVRRVENGAEDEE